MIIIYNKVQKETFYKKIAININGVRGKGETI
jgi:hypothetical protein